MASYAEPNTVQIEGDSACDDVQLMKAGILSLAQQKPIHCGFAGAVLRFLALKAARIPGRHILYGHKRLFERPQQPLLDNLQKLGVRAMIKYATQPKLIIDSEGWKPSRGALVVDRSISSQFASGIVLNAWGLPFDLSLRFSSESVSPSYLELSLALVKTLGMKIQRDSEEEIIIPALQKPAAGTYRAESDMSSAFAVAALAAVNGRALVEHFPEKSLQPDYVFVDLLKKMGANVSLHKSVLEVEKAEHLKHINCNLRNAPDLFPVLAVLCALADGVSVLSGAPHLTHKESNRILKVMDLIQLMGREVEERADGLLIHGNSTPFSAEKKMYNPDGDHRLAMAAAVAMQAGLNLELKTPEVVNKSFPEFWEIFLCHSELVRRISSDD